jgi:Flp pilus assembly pilin Flp
LSGGRKQSLEPVNLRFESLVGGIPRSVNLPIVGTSITWRCGRLTNQEGITPVAVRTNPSDRSTQLHHGSFETAGPDEGRPRTEKEVNYTMIIAEWFDFVRRTWRKEEGQTMAEYGVVLAVVCVLTVAAFTALHTGIAGAITSVVTNL